MGFFKDFKRDFAQAVNELMPEDGELSNEYDDEDMVNTFDDDDADTEIDPTDLIDEDAADISDIGDLEEPAVETLASDDDVQEDELIGPDPGAAGAELAEPELSDEEETELYEESEEDEPEEYEADEYEDDEAEEYESEDEEADEEDAEADESDEADEGYEAADDEEDGEEYEDEPAENEMMSIDAAVQETLVRDAANEVDEMDDRDVKTKDAMTEKKENVESVMSDDTTYITKGTKITGNIETDGGVDVLGSVVGNIKCMGKLILGGQVKGNVTAGEIYANAAKLEGEVVTDGGVKIGVGSVVIGNITATSAVIAGAVNGDIDIKGPVIVDSTAVVMGNIKSRSVQINNGAVIEGFCSQCYSEIDVKSFFGNAD